MNTETLINNINIRNVKCLDLIRKKSSDYAKPDSDTLSNFKNSLIVGVSLERGVLVRIMDKISRISNLLDKDASVVGESIEDSIQDSINYIHILGCVIDNNKSISHEASKAIKLNM